MFPIVKDHYLNDNKNIDNHLMYLHHPPLYLHQKVLGYDKYDMYIFLFSLLLHLFLYGGAKEDRTPDLLRAKQALSQLSYGPYGGSEKIWTSDLTLIRGAL